MLITLRTSIAASVWSAPSSFIPHLSALSVCACLSLLLRPAPEKIENTYQRCKYIAQSFVHGDGLESTLVAVVVPDEEELALWAQKQKVPFSSFAQLVANPLVKQLIMEEMNVVAKEAQLNDM